MNENRAQFISMNWLIKTAQEKGNSEKFSNVLAKEIIDAAKNQVYLYAFNLLCMYNIMI